MNIKDTLKEAQTLKVVPQKVALPETVYRTMRDKTPPSAKILARMNAPMNMALGGIAQLPMALELRKNIKEKGITNGYKKSLGMQTDESI